MKALKLNIPKNWIELNSKQLLHVSYLLLTEKSRSDLLVKLLYFLSGIKLVKLGWLGKRLYKQKIAIDGSPVYWHWHKAVKQFFVLSALEIASMAEQCSFILDVRGEVKPLKRIRFAKSFSFRLYDATFEHFLMAENYMTAYDKTKDTAHLDNLCAVLYTLPFHRFNSDKIQKRSRWFRSVAIHKKYTVYLWYSGFRNYLTSECHHLFKSSGSGKKLDMKQQVIAMMRMVNKGDITLNKAVLNAPLWDALYEMEAQAEEYDRQQQNK